jgi:hypothetical protein
MYLQKREARKLLAKLGRSAIGAVEEKVMFLLDLVTEDDWTFVIKAHALIETVVTQMLAQHLGQLQLTKVIELLPLSDTRTGKIAVAKELNILDERQRRFIRSFSELRNSLVHRLDNLNFCFESYLSTLDSNQRRSWRENTTWFVYEDDSRKEWESIAEDNPKLAIYMALHCLVAHCVITSEETSAMRELNDVALRTTGGVVNLERQRKQLHTSSNATRKRQVINKRKTVRAG